MTTEIVHTDGKCGKQFRIKRWNQGYSIKCLQKQKTIVCRPYYEDYYQGDLKMFCEGCERVKQS